MNDNNISFEALVGAGDQNNSSSPTPPIQPKNNSFNIASLVLGIISVIASCCINEYVGIVCGILGIVFYVLAKRSNISNGMATAGLVCGIVGLVLSAVSIISTIILGAVIASNPEYSSLFESIMNMQL